jgi:hypothetical protein
MKTAPTLVQRLAAMARNVPIAGGVTLLIYVIADALGVTLKLPLPLAALGVGIAIGMSSTVAMVVLVMGGWREAWQALAINAVVGIGTLAVAGFGMLAAARDLPVPRLDSRSPRSKVEGEFDWEVLEIPPETIGSSLAAKPPESKPGAQYTRLKMYWRRLVDGGVVWSNDGKFIYCLHKNGELWEVQVDSLTLRRKLITPKPIRLERSARGLLVCARAGTELLIIDERSFSIVERIAIPQSQAVCASPVSNTVCLLAEPGMLMLIDLAARRSLAKVHPVLDLRIDMRLPIRNIRFSSDGKLLLAETIESLSAVIHAFSFDGGKLKHLPEITGSHWHAAGEPDNAFDLWHASARPRANAPYRVAGTASGVLLVGNVKSNSSREVLVPGNNEFLYNTGVVMQPYERSFIAWRAHTNIEKDYTAWVTLQP